MAAVLLQRGPVLPCHNELLEPKEKDSIKWVSAVHWNSYSCTSFYVGHCMSEHKIKCHERYHLVTGLWSWASLGSVPGQHDHGMIIDHDIKHDPGIRTSRCCWMLSSCTDAQGHLKACMSAGCLLPQPSFLHQAASTIA